MKKIEILNMVELSRLLRIPKGTLYKMCERGKIPSFKVGKQLRFRGSAIKRWIEVQEKDRLKKNKKKYRQYLKEQERRVVKR